jgi:DNA-binding Xre family transcriptional regulator
MEIEKANLLVQQQLTEKDKRATFKMAEMTIDKLKKVYDEAVKDLEKIVQEWNIEWRNTCEVREGKRYAVLV